ncbi:GroES-like protein [Zopfia rhizophila CBS 207.26]|uniref:alcohol dehydrogenase (NADP(+)) n=1 Tax=Zopfia rhizophila CBS 207.26 TaxID=1314779 RepID=A0A6A6EH85_9PEZI|nr:GroES-like protein [Zopfia rhizophila CBS 207.26]
MPYPDTTDAFVVTDIKKWSDFKRQEVPLKKFEDHDVDVAVDACGVCASDVHKINGGWGEDIPLPLCVGHEIIGKAVKVGPKVKDIKVGDRVGVGAQISADLTCAVCKSDNENYCPNQIDTYGGTYPDGTISQGGYSSHVRAHEYFTFKIPDGLDTALVAPMLCAGLTTYSPLKRLGAGPGKKVAIVGLGGLGHFGVLWSVALGAETYVLSHSPNKKEDALSLGAKEFISTKDKNWAEPWRFTFDFIINCADATDRFRLPDYFSTLKVNGTFHMVGFPDKPLPTLMAQDFAPTGCFLGASHIGNRPEMIEMLELAAKQNVKSWVETIDISAEGCKEAVERVYNGDNVKFRFTLVNYDKVFGKRA